MLCHLFMERLFCLPNVHICAVLAGLNIIHYIILLMPGCSVLGKDEFLPLHVCRVRVWGFDKGPVLVARCFKCSPDVLLFPILSLCNCGYGFSLMVYGSDDPQLMLQWMLRDKQQVLICVEVFCTPQCWGFCLLWCLLHSPRKAHCLRWHLPM